MSVGVMKDEKLKPRDLHVWLVKPHDRKKMIMVRKLAVNQDKITRLLKQIRIIPHESHVICGNKYPLSRSRHHEHSITNDVLY